MRINGFAFVGLGLAALLSVCLNAQQSQPGKEEQKPPALKESLPRRELSEKERKKREERLRKELESHYKKWLEGDVVYIITPEEREVFLHLSTEEEREQFVEQFWLRRDPTPDTIENEYKEEHYRRIAYTNERFTAGKPGWLTDRGRIYILHGPADEIESYPGGSTYNELPEEGQRSMIVYSTERWRYRYLPDVGTNIMLEFLDRNSDGDYQLMLDPSEKEVFYTPGATTRLTEPLLWTDYDDPDHVHSERARFQLMERVDRYMKAFRPPPVKFKDLEALVQTRITFNVVPFNIRIDFLRITDETVLIPITMSLEKKHLTFQGREGVQRAVVNVFGRITTLGGRVVQTFEDQIEVAVPDSLLSQALTYPSVYQKAVPLRPGLYKLSLVIKDIFSGNVGAIEQRLTVPRFEEDKLAHSSLILADLIERLPTKNVGSGQFVIGDTKVRPAVGEEFKRNQQMGIYLQVYNLGIDEATHKPDATIDYRILRGKQVLVRRVEKTAEMERAQQQLTLEKSLPLEVLQPGEYELEITITDNVRQQTLKPAAKFRVLP